jgi:hypothetical protein
MEIKVKINTNLNCRNYQILYLIDFIIQNSSRILWGRVYGNILLGNV